MEDKDFTKKKQFWLIVKMENIKKILDDYDKNVKAYATLDNTIELIREEINRQDVNKG